MSALNLSKFVFSLGWYDRFQNPIAGVRKWKRFSFNFVIAFGRLKKYFTRDCESTKGTRGIVNGFSIVLDRKKASFTPMAPIFTLCSPISGAKRRQFFFLQHFASPRQRDNVFCWLSLRWSLIFHVYFFLPSFIQISNIICEKMRAQKRARRKKECTMERRRRIFILNPSSAFCEIKTEKQTRNYTESRSRWMGRGDLLQNEARD